MSTSIVLWAGTLDVPGAEALLVMASALGLCSAAAATLYQLAPRPHPDTPVNTETVQPDRRHTASTVLSSLGRRRHGAGRRGSQVGSPSPAPSGEALPVAVIGYATFSGQAGKETEEDLAKQAEVIARACDQRGLALLEMVGDRHEERRLFRPKLLDAPPGLGYALERIAAGDAQGLVVPGLRRLTHSAAALGPIVEWLLRREARLVAVAQGFDTAERAGQVAARLIIEVSRWEREGLWEPAREGQSPSRGTGASDGPDDASHLLSRSGGESS